MSKICPVHGVLEAGEAYYVGHPFNKWACGNCFYEWVIMSFPVEEKDE